MDEMMKALEGMWQPIRARYLGHVTGYQPIREETHGRTDEGSGRYVMGNVA